MTFRFLSLPLPARAGGAPVIGIGLLPGLALCGAVTLAAYGLAAVEHRLFGRAWLEPLVLAILVGAAVRTAWTPSGQCFAGIDFAARTLLEVAVVLLGLSVGAAIILAVGPGLVFGIAVVVVLAIPTSFLIGRLLGLPMRMALLVACGNSICGNSAIAAVAPVIGADGDDIAASIAFTAVLGVVVVLVLPLIGIAAGLSGLQYGALAGLTVYAVPQVLAAAAPMGPIAIHIGTLVKLIRVLMLGPACVMLSLLAPGLRKDRPGGGRPPIHRMVPWFIVGFLAMIAVRSLDLVPAVVLAPAGHAATLLTVLSMAALGLGVDVRVVARAGVRVTGAAVLSLVALGLMGFALIRLVGI